MKNILIITMLLGALYGDSSTMLPCTPDPYCIPEEGCANLDEAACDEAGCYWQADTSCYACCHYDTCTNYAFEGSCYGGTYHVGSICDEDPCGYTDCEGNWDGTAFIDECGVCSEGNTGHAANSDIDCAGVCFGYAFIDECGVCNGNGDCENNGTCCFSTNECWQPDYNPDREGCMDICEQGIAGDICNMRPAPIEGLGALCNSGLSSQMPWHSGGETCALYTEEACCVNGYHQDSSTGYEWEESTQHSCNEESPNLYPIDCNTDDCEEVYDEGYTAGLEEGILIGGQSGDANGDGTLNVLDIVIFVEMVLNP